MLYVYLIISATLIPLLNNFFDILQQPYSWWLVPVLFIGFFITFVLLQGLAFLLIILTANPEKETDPWDKPFRFLLKHTLPIIVFLARVKINYKGLEKMPENQGFSDPFSHRTPFSLYFSAFNDTSYVLCEQGSLHFYFVLSSANYVADSGSGTQPIVCCIIDAYLLPEEN